MPSNSDRGPSDEGPAPDDGESASFVERVLDVVDAIPPGHVMTYGDVAAALGSRAARMVGQVMAYYGSDVPWWRVVRASGHPAVHHEHIALQHYRAEGTPLLGGGTTPYRVDLRAARYDDARNHPSDR
ncbi:MGMT family protein [Leifsonia soli]|uniref:Alkylated DNA nucleotide flippase Atl1 n=1 Tax=Leifsonia soli TaxID=582665 RepID=A0A852T093_9MICO|nr:alkylated DNA nucleotide flippase Atl1 [Leifsonia soli]SEA58290.1 Alkylated DNA nucleotide flippase Atl1, participates in nucleotide excision repair, Ada-like DNA-binding domain [Leifsonia sp. 21MFCrub1.1]